jgi:hypothetical protein
MHHLLYISNLLSELMWELNSKWEEVDHELADSAAGALLSPLTGDAEGDPLGLRNGVKCVLPLGLSAFFSLVTCLSVREMDMESSAFVINIPR